MNYVQEQWQFQTQQQQHKKVVRVLAWITGVAALIGVAALLTERVWYPYVQQYF